MHKFIEGVFLNELIKQCEYAVTAIKRMNELLNARSKPSDFFREASAFLQHSSSVSRILWPPGCSNRKRKKRAKQRGDYLRTSLGLADDHLLKNRALRDHFEHFDERLDDWAETSLHKNIVDDMIGPRSAIGGTAIQDRDIFRMFDPTSKLLVFRGERFDIQALTSGIEDIYKKSLNRQKILEDNHALQGKIGTATV